MDTKSLPTNIDAERFVLGSILLDGTRYADAAGKLAVEDFSVEAHRKIYRAMGGLETIDRVTVANALMQAGELEAVGGLSFLVSLDEGLPQVTNIDSYIRIVLDKSTLRKICYASHNLIGAACDSAANPTELLAKAGADFLALAERGQESSLLSPKEIIEKAGGVNAFLDRKARGGGVPSGYDSLDKLIGGFKPGALYILAARPAMGKTALAMNIAERVVLAGGTVPVFSLEMDSESILVRLLCSNARVNTRRFEGGWTDAEERERIAEALGRISDSWVRIDDKAVTNLQEIHSKIRQQQAKGPVSLVVLDYLQLLIGGKASERVAEASLISRGLKLIAKDCKVPVLALSQLSRACELREDKRPMLSDLRETGSIEQDADVVFGLYRGEVYNQDREDLRGLAELILLKQRNGPIGVVNLVWLKEIVRFEERAE